jgi:hypothetical protein
MLGKNKSSPCAWLCALVTNMHWLFPLAAVRALQAQFNYTDVDLFQFLTNTECLEATFDR